MGVYDILVDGDRSVQVKCWPNLSIKSFHVGDEVPSPFPDMTIVCPDYGIYSDKGNVFVIIKDHRLVKLTKDSSEAVPPYIDKWGASLDTSDDFENPFVALVESPTDPKTPLAQGSLHT